MKQIRMHFQSEEEKKRYVEEGDAAFEVALSEAVLRIAQTPGLRLVTVSGPTCSGKTTASSKLEAELEKGGHRVHVVSIDDFYIDRDILLARSDRTGDKPDFDSPDSIDTETLRETTEQIFAGTEVTVPNFDFISGVRSGFRTISDPLPGDVFLFEGIQAIYPAVTSLFGCHPFRSVFISVGEDAEYGDTVFPRDEIRFLRRLVRDSLFRGATTEFTFRIWETVRENERKNILPFSGSSEVILRSYLPYELNMIAPYAARLLSDIPRGSVYAGEAARLLRKLEPIPAIPRDFLSPKSLFREFLG